MDEDLIEFLRVRLDEDAVLASMHPDAGRAQADVAAKRGIVDDLASVISASEKYQGPDYYEGVDACERTLKRLALPYAGHADYNEAWRP